MYATHGGDVKRMARRAQAPARAVGAAVLDEASCPPNACSVQAMHEFVVHARVVHVGIATNACAGDSDNC